MAQPREIDSLAIASTAKVRAMRVTEDGLRHLGVFIEPEIMVWRDAKGDRWEVQVVV